MQEKFLPELIREITGDVKKIQTPQTIERARAYFAKAKVDLESAKMLYEKKIFDNAIFLLQQSVEKATKAYYILYSGASKKQLKKIRHIAPLAFLKLYRKFSTKYLNAIKILKPDWDSSFIDGFDALIKDKRKFARLNKEKIVNLINFPRQVFEPTSTLGREVLSILGKGDIARIVKSISGEDVGGELLLEGVRADLALLIFAYLTFPHAIDTRYPGGFIKPADYTKGLGIVDAAPEMFKELEKSLQFIVKQTVVTT